jgi:hypothetical protein
MITDDITQHLRALYVETGDARMIEAAETIAALRAYRDSATVSHANLLRQMKILEERLMAALADKADQF